jgi:hypothetical protein
MRTLKFIILLLLLTCPVILNAQYSDFDLSRYKLPDIKLTRLDAYFNLANSEYRYQNVHFNNDSSKWQHDKLDGTLNFDYYHFRNTDKYQGDLNALVSGQLNNSKYKDENSNQILNNNQLNFIISNINRFYKNRNFIEIDPAVSITRNISYTEYSASNVYSNDQFNTNLSLPVSIGHGKIEPVEDLRLAIYILEELNKAGRIDNMPSDNVLLEMAKVISKIKRQRFFDTRIRKIKELQVVDSFLIANNIVSSYDINYFAVLNDQWDYASGPVRTAGFAINIGIDDHIKFNRSHQDNSYNSEDTDIKAKKNIYYLGGFSRVRYDKPVNLYWQTSATLRIAYGFEFTRDQPIQFNPANNYRTDIFNTMLGYSIRFLPNSRTSAELSLTGNYSNLRGDRPIYNPDPVVFHMMDNQFTVIAGFDMYYYISPRFRLQINSTFNYYNQHDRNTNNTHPALKNLTSSLQNDLAVTLIYSLF